MTQTFATQPIPKPQRIERSRAMLQIGTAVALVSVFLLTVALRWFRVHEAWDVYVDEITYLRLAQNAIGTGRIELYGEPFYLHPPLVFFLQGAFLALTGASGGLIDLVYATRDYNVLVAGLTSVVLFLLGRAYGGPLLGGILAFTFAIDPFANRLNVRTLLEPTAMLFVTSGYAILATRLRRNGRLGAWQIVLTGVLFGFGLLCKEMTLFCCTVPVMLAGLRNAILPFRQAVGIAAASLATYALYPIAVFAGGDGLNFLEHKLRGFYRLAGLVKETGFKHGGPSFTDALIANLDRLGTTYLLLALSVPAIVLLWRQRQAAYRLLSVWTFCTYGLIGYALGFGTIEEQFFYYLFIPALVVNVIAASLIVRGRMPSNWLTSAQTGVVVLALGYGMFSAFSWTRVHFAEDDGFERLVAYVDANVPVDASIAATNETAVFVFDRHRTGSWGTIDALVANQADYAVFSVKEVYKGYGYARPDAYEWARANGELVFAFAGPTNERLELYRLPTASR